VLRTHKAGSLRAEHIGQTVTLTGWVDRRRDHGGVAFIDLRDASGIAQVVIRDEETAHPLRSEFVLKVTGQVSGRPEGNANDNLATGDIEVIATDVEVLNESAPLPFQVSTALDGQETVGEEARLKHRYLDLRRPAPARMLRLRSDAAQVARRVLNDAEFTEVETPTLTRSTPEGARDFVVPARLSPGSWYALPQSPQLFKQLLMVGGVERYYQLARSYRDEDFRADRQPEFTQLDIEMAFVDQEDVIALGEKLVSELWKLIDVQVPTPIERITFADAMRLYGSDKPDLRFGNPIVELASYFADTTFRVFQQEYVGAVVYTGGASLPRRQFDAWQDWAKSRGAKGLAYVTFQEDGTLGGPVAKNLSDAERDGLAEVTGAKPGDAVFFAAGSTSDAQALLGAARVEIAKQTGEINNKAWAFVWVVDAPISATRRGPPCTTRSPRRSPSTSTRSTRIRRTPSRTPTTSSATASRWEADRSVSTVATCRSACSASWASARRRRRRSSASCSTRSPSAPRRTAASRSAGTAPSRCWPVSTRSARSSRSRRPATASTR
jgi:aspartyl-tRNA synthetase